MPEITYIILQILAIILPILIFHTFIGEQLENKPKKIVRIYDFFFWFLALILCMSLPTLLTTDYRFDLRTIPITLGFLYSGYTVGFLLVGLSVLFRILLGEMAGVYHYILVLLFFIPSILFVIKSYDYANRKKRIRLFILISLYPFVCSWFALILLGNVQFLKSSINTDFLYYVTVTIIASWISVFLIESIRENIQMRIELHNVEKKNLLRDLTTVFAHEIRNPMQAVRGFLQLLDEPDLTPEKKKYIKISIEELDRVNNIITEFLYLSKPQKEEVQEIEVRTQLLRVISIVQSYALTKKITIKTNLHDNCRILVNPQKLNQGLINILKNGIEASGDTVSIACYPYQNKYIVIDIEDNGIGMTKDQIMKLGTPFYSLKEKGTGIGLMVSYQIIESFQGEISVTSEKGKGTRFSILLPSSSGATLPNTTTVHESI